MWSDLHFAARQLVRNPSYAIVAVMTLALGIMATTAMYSVLYAVVLDPFPYKDVDRLTSVKVWEPGQRNYRTGYIPDQFLEIAERNSIFEGVVASTVSDVLWTSDSDPRRLRGNFGTPNTFQIMGVAPLLGRTYLPSDGAPGADPVVVIGYRFWQRQFGGDPAIVGRQLRLNDRLRTVVGVMPKRFMWRGADVYIPVTLQRGKYPENVHYVHLLGRLKPGVTAAQAEVDLHPIIADLKQRAPDQFPEHWRVGLLSFKETFPSGLQETLWILLGAVGLLLLIACANVSNLLLARASSRQREMTVRSALGASRGRLVRQLLTESLLLAVLGACVGVGLAYEGLHLILTWVPPDTIPDEAEIRLNLPVLLFTLGVSGLASVLFGLTPAMHTCTRDLANSLRESSRGLAGATRQGLLRKGLVIAEVGLSLVLLVAASLMIRTFLTLQDVQLGFHPDQLLTMRVPLADQRYSDPDRRIVFFQDLIRRLKALPGVTAVGLNTSVHPMENWSMAVQVIGAAQEDARQVELHQINAEYPRTFGIGLVEGRYLSEDDVSGKRRLAVVNESFVRDRLGGRLALGRTFRLPEFRGDSRNPVEDTFEIVGVVKDTARQNLNGPVPREIYIPFTLLARADRVVVLTSAGPSTLTRAMAAQVYAIDKNQPVTGLETLQAVLDDGIYAGPRFNLALFSLFAGLGLTLALVGVYGVMANSVTQQAREIGVRIAIGASGYQIVGMVIKRGLWLLLAGILLGLLGGVFAARLIAGHIASVAAFDPISFGIVALILLATGLLACLLPAVRAARVDPMEALRAD